MSFDDREDRTAYKVIVSPEGQYSIWPADRENAIGYSDAGVSGTKQECLSYIREASRGGPAPRGTVDESGGERGDL